MSASCRPTCSAATDVAAHPDSQAAPGRRGTDDTGLPVLDREHLNGIKRGHIWACLSDGGYIYTTRVGKLRVRQASIAPRSPRDNLSALSTHRRPRRSLAKYPGSRPAQDIAPPPARKHGIVPERRERVRRPCPLVSCRRQCYK
jgi:hypothetical protein